MGNAEADQTADVCGASVLQLDQCRARDGAHLLLQCIQIITMATAVGVEVSPAPIRGKRLRCYWPDATDARTLPLG